LNKYNSHIHHRRSIRLKGYDYSQAGFYFITICVQHRECLFGKIINGKMIWNDAGMMVQKWYIELENKFPDIHCHQMIVMPNHFHCIIENDGMSVGADLRVCPYGHPQLDHIRANDFPLDHIRANDFPLDHIGGEHVGSPLYRVVQWFKTMTTNEYIRGVKKCGWKPFNGKLWQRNYYEHIIRNNRSYEIISKYIANNPAKWNV